MRGLSIAIILLVVFAVGIASGIYLDNGLLHQFKSRENTVQNVAHSSPAVSVEAKLASKPIIESDNTSWTFEISLSLKPRSLSHPLEISGVDVFVKVETGKGSVWIRAERNVIGGFSYSYIGDMLVVPGEVSNISITVETPVSFKPVNAVVIVHLKGYGDLYSSVIDLSK